ncbi:hypothetical protein B0T19DRAFT_158877 [Cercophora scortea]|uniref:Uncharacterized protein n=1 Tax=Cercophora scortea TaxID=314031 RepID=A0AAE0ILG5_9PEZI|nr:hypothetical protein B0T19DRAFT_158877 [Cercophora scortea]
MAFRFPQHVTTSTVASTMARYLLVTNWCLSVSLCITITQGAKIRLSDRPTGRVTFHPPFPPQQSLSDTDSLSTISVVESASRSSGRVHYPAFVRSTSFKPRSASLGRVRLTPKLREGNSPVNTAQPLFVCQPTITRSQHPGSHHVEVDASEGQTPHPSYHVQHTEYQASHSPPQ